MQNSSFITLVYALMTPHKEELISHDIVLNKEISGTSGEFQGASGRSGG